MKSILIEVSVGEFLDRLAILYVKQENGLPVAQEIASLEVLDIQGPDLSSLMELHRRMWKNNEARKHYLHANLPLDATFTKLAYEESRLNNERFRLKDEINQAVGADLREQKSAVYHK